MNAKTYKRAFLIISLIFMLIGANIFNQDRFIPITILSAIFFVGAGIITAIEEKLK